MITLTADITLTTILEMADGDNGLPSIVTPIIINGNGYGISRSGAAPDFRLLRVASPGSLILNNTTLRNGRATVASPPTGRGGGAIYITRAPVTITNSVITDNFADLLGGAIYIHADYLIIKNTLFTNNTVTQSGGVINSSSADVAIDGSTFRGNRSTAGNAGAINNYRGILSVNRSTFSGNDAQTSSAGAIHNYRGDAVITNSTISGNIALRGGGVENLLGRLEIISSTITGNTATGIGGGLHNVVGTTRLSNTIIAGNTSPLMTDCNISRTTLITDANNLLGTDGTGGGNCNIGPTDLTPNTPIGSILSPLANNGGPTQTHALVAGSPALDIATGGTLTDQRGVPIQNGVRDSGAFERGASPTYPTVAFAATGASYDESVGTVTVPMTISGAANFAGTAEVYIFDTASGTATSSSDYAAFPFTTVTIDCSAGCPSTATVTFTINSDGVIPEPAETAILRLAATNGFATLGAQQTYTVEIQEQILSTFTPTFTHTFTPTFTNTPTFTPTFTPIPTDTPVPTDTPTVTPTPTGSATTTFTPTETPTSPTDTPTITPTVTGTLSATPTETATPIPPTYTLTPTITPSFTVTGTLSATPTATATPTYTPTVTLSATPTETVTLTHTPTVTGTLSATPTASATYTATPTFTPTNTFTPTVTGTLSATPTPSMTSVAVAAAVNADVTATPSPTETLTVEAALPKIDIFDPSISKIGLLLPGQVGVTGEQLVWTVTVRNVGDAPGVNVVITDTIDTRLRIDDVRAVGATVNINGQQVTVTYPLLNPGQAVEFQIITTVLEGEEVNNTACVGADNQAEPECVTAVAQGISTLPVTGESQFAKTMRVLLLMLAVGVGLVVSLWLLRRTSTQAHA